MKFRRDKESKPIPVLLDKTLRDRINAVSRKMGEPKSTVMRIAMRIGLEGLEKTFESSPEIASAARAEPNSPGTATEFLKKVAAGLSEQSREHARRKPAK